MTNTNLTNQRQVFVVE